MLRSLIAALLLLLPFSVRAAIWPEALGDFVRQSVAPVGLSDREVWREYGLDAAEQAVYTTSSGTSFTGTALRLSDSTAGLAVLQWLTPAVAQPIEYATFEAFQSGNSTLFTLGNYVLRFDGGRPEEDVFYEFYANLPKLERGPLPVLPRYLPAENLIAGSRRYILGPSSLEKFVDGVPPATAAFSLGAEAQTGRYRLSSGEVLLAIFSYPTPQMARERSELFREIDGVVVKRTGPLVAITLPPADPNDAERLLALVNYHATVTWNEKVTQRQESVSEMLIAIFKLIGLMIAFTLLAGFGFAGFRILRRRVLGESANEEAMLTLHLDDR
jgi:hypothetical protein